MRSLATLLVPGGLLQLVGLILLRPGMLLTLEVIRDSKTAPAVPERAVTALGDKLFVYTLDNGRAQQKPVTTGMHQDGLVAITSGLQAGERVVADGTHKLRPGQRVQIVEIDGKAAKPPAARPQS